MRSYGRRRLGCQGVTPPPAVAEPSPPFSRLVSYGFLWASSPALPVHSVQSYFPNSACTRGSCLDVANYLVVAVLETWSPSCRLSFYGNRRLASYGFLWVLMLCLLAVTASLVCFDCSLCPLCLLCFMLCLLCLLRLHALIALLACSVCFACSVCLL